MIQPSTEFEQGRSARKVYVVNADTEPYEEEYKGEHFIIPPNMEKKVVMPAWKARKFIASAVPPKTNVYGEMIKGGRNKMLRMIEIEEPREYKEDPNNKCMLCDFNAKSSAGLAKHVSSKHPERTPIE